ncbi:uL15 family ribosomal protein [Candidatus Woesearchaeota archaeon]|nr:uL15 family ribosomal protein [Candidatus Woesearchaeota archaeon]
MTVNRRKKVSRQRGSHTHGWGSKKKHRGSGNRGGRGRAGTGKRADQMKTLYWKKRYFGKMGFKYHGVEENVNAINLDDLQEKIPFLISQKLITEDKGTYNIDLGKLGYNKLLGTGNASKKMKINVKYASENAVEKIKDSGGEVILAEKKQLPPKQGKKEETVKK